MELDKIVAFFICGYILSVFAEGFPDRFPIGVIFDRDSSDIQYPFKYTIGLHNNNETKSAFKIDVWEEFVNIRNSYELGNAICNETKKGTFAILGAKDLLSSDVIQSYSRTLHMPYLTIGPVPNEKPFKNEFILNMRPSYTAAIIDLIKYFNWTNVHYLYDNYEGLVRVQEVITTFLVNEDADTKIELHPMQVINTNNAYDILRHIDQWEPRKPTEKELAELPPKTPGKRYEPKPRHPAKNIILDFSSKLATQSIMRQLQEMGMNRMTYHYIIAGLDVSEFDLSGFHHSGVNLTGFRLIDPKNKEVQNFVKEWSELNPLDWPGAGTKKLPIDTALIVDSIHAVVWSLLSIKQHKEPHLFRKTFRRGQVYNNGTRGIPCKEDPVPWQHGQLLMEELKKVSFPGLSGKVAFNRYGYRSGFNLDLLTLVEKRGLKKVATWNDNGLQVTSHHWRFLNYSRTSEYKVYKITSIKSAPYMTMRTKDDNGKPLVGNARFEGYCADLINEISQILRFDYVIRFVKDKNYGAIDEVTGRWNGMMGEVIEQQADMAVAPLTINVERERVVDFTKPFMSLGISIMIKKPEKQKPGVFSFMDPLSNRVWACVTIACIASGFLLFLVGRISPYQFCIKEDCSGIQTDDEFTLFNCIWFALGALMCQGGDITLRSLSTRVVGSVWSLFTLIMISSYTANLAAFLTIERLLTPIDSAEDLSKQTKIVYGTLKGGSTNEFFRSSNISIYKTMWNFMDSAKPSVFTDNTEGGVARVRNSKGRYAFLLESTTNDYVNQRKPCNTMKVGDNLDSKGFGIATQIGNPLRKELNLAVLKLRETNVLPALEKKWWYDKSECLLFEEGGSSSNTLTLSNVAGVFYILIGGFGLAMAVSLLEFMYKANKEASKRKVSKDPPLPNRHLQGVLAHSERTYMF
ncbi:glutamate receptor 3-like isoform X2 [Lineus longissimus]|uniref:glutamate receptor 3-like isoform X2 n=1 Tax=Lineus longissimus TaxID=88925 RepID=UPI00315D3FB9